MNFVRAGKPVEIESTEFAPGLAGRAIVLTTLGLLALGVVAVNSATVTVAQPGPWYARVDVRHTIFAVVAAGVLVLGGKLDYRKLFGGGDGPVPWVAMGLLVLALGLGLLVFVPGLGHAVGGRYRWIRIGPRQFSIGFGPSELIKISLVIFLAAWLGRAKTNVRSFWTFAGALACILASAAVVITQDFGTAVLICIAGFVVMFLAGVPWYYLFTIVPPGVGAGWYFILAAPYRLGRIQAMLDPWCHANQSAYQGRQSLLAILAGGWTGVGLGKGVRKLGFLPEDSTDFIFASFCEEWGFRGAAMLIVLLLMWLMFCRKAAVGAPDRFGRVLAGGLGATIIIQAIGHIAVNLVLLPTTGISLPFVSAGGTSLLIMAGAAALITSVATKGQAPAELGQN